MGEVDPLRNLLTTVKTLGQHGTEAVKSFIDQGHRIASDVIARAIETAPTPPTPPRLGETRREEEKVTFPSVGPLPEVTIPSPIEVIKKVEEAVKEIPRPKVEGEKEGEKEIAVEEGPAVGIAAVRETRISVEV